MVGRPALARLVTSMAGVTAARASAEPALSPAVKKARLVKSYFKGRPIWCTWQLTPRCASLCQFCEHRAEGAAVELDAEGCRRVVDGLSGMGSLVVSLSGGDPFLRTDLPEIVRALARNHFPLVTTHGWLVSRENARELWRAGLEAASVTLDHAAPAAQDEAAGIPGAHGRALAALEAFSAERTRSGQQVNVKTRLRSADLSGLPALLELAARHQATLSVEPTYPLPLAGGEGSGVAAGLRQLKGRHPNLRTGSFFLQHLEEALVRGVPGCQAGRAFFNVDERGFVSKCLEFRAPEDRAGEVGRDAAPTIHGRLRAIQAANSCRACWYSTRGEVEGLYTLRGFFSGLGELRRG
jgi:MoaA/NifB/PqqE/SkfB family radical SAM enzyme